jgi:hypothetical protein
VPEGRPDPTAPHWRTIDQLARHVGGYCWLERQLFEVTGAWASGDGEPAIRVFFSEMSARHARHSTLWWDRLPVRAGVDPAALVIAPAAVPAAAFTLLRDEPSALNRLGGLIDVVLPRVLGTYRAHLAEATPVSEGPVIEVLALISRSGDDELRDGANLLLQGLETGVTAGPSRPTEVDEFCHRIERSFGEP